ncbi:hypothetical protein FOL47_001124 [Perkinsus chesapeaki]|uniref:Peptidase M14 domain-containing protein n=1 Tax=Perkinsus chesapeaki TaxID=330153 RepID=A0A7J6MK27_PERCH|nr:hypothetical protein FOL47_001124 [Perkinsus chesapeaki]
MPPWPQALLGLLVLAFVGVDASVLPAFYHSTQKIRIALKNLVGICPGMSVTELHDDGISMTEVHFKNMAVDTAKPAKSGRALLVFGEHARELISSEIALDFIQQVCDIRNGKRRPTDTTQAAMGEMTILPIVNEAGRSIVMDKEDWCWRGNENGVDLNRNFGGSAHWSSRLRSVEENSGPSQFSEPETKARCSILRSLIDGVAPNFFLSVHSGMLGLFYPYAYSPQAHPRTAVSLESVLDKVADKGCQCPSGQASLEIGHGAPGSSLDYAFNDGRGAQFAYAVEVYSDPSHRSLFHEEYQQRKGVKAALITYLRGVSSADFGPIVGQKCLEYFNPMTQDEYSDVLQTWSNNILMMMQLSSSSGMETSSPALRGIAVHNIDTSIV